LTGAPVCQLCQMAAARASSRWAMRVKTPCGGAAAVAFEAVLAFESKLFWWNALRAENRWWLPGDAAAHWCLVEPVFESGAGSRVRGPGMLL
jgi:hypothetical protein